MVFIDLRETCNKVSITIDFMVQSRSRPLTRQALRRISRGVSDRSRAIHAKCYIESLKFFEKTKQNLKNIYIDINIYVSHV